MSPIFASTLMVSDVQCIELRMRLFLYVIHGYIFSPGVYNNVKREKKIKRHLKTKKISRYNTASSSYIIIYFYHKKYIILYHSYIYSLIPPLYLFFNYLIIYFLHRISEFYKHGNFVLF